MFRQKQTVHFPYQGYTKRDDCNSTDVINHITSLVNKDAGGSGAKFICCGEDGCNWSEDLATDNVSILETALPFIIAGIIALAILVICCAVCCGECDIVTILVTIVGTMIECLLA